MQLRAHLSRLLFTLKILFVKHRLEIKQDKILVYVYRSEISPSIGALESETAVFISLCIKFRLVC
jgi:hypothetical protein